MFRAILILVVGALSLWAQPSPGPPFLYTTTNPNGNACIAGASINIVLVTTGAIYTCSAASLGAAGTYTASGGSSIATSIDAGGATSVTNGTNGDVLTIAAGKVSHATPISLHAPYVYDGTNCYIGQVLRQATLVNAANFSWLRQSTATEVADGSTCTARVLKDLTSHAGTSVAGRVASRGSDSIATIAFSCVSGLDSSGNLGTLASCGVGFRNSTTGQMVLLNIGTDGSQLPAIAVNRFDSETSFNAAAMNNGHSPLITSGQSVVNWWQIRFDGTNLQWYFCGDLPPTTSGSGPATSNCFQVWGETAATFLTNGAGSVDQWMYYIQADNTNSGMEVYSWATTP